MTFNQLFVQLKNNKMPLKQKGQIVVEYVLMLVVGVLIAFVIVNALINRNEEDPGYLITKWHSMLKAIGSDLSD